MLAAVEALRAALPPGADAATGDRERALAALHALRGALPPPPLAPPLLPLQREVLFRQLAHVVAVARPWPPSGTADAVLAEALECLASLLVDTPSEPPTGALLSSPRLRGTFGALLSELLLAAAPRTRWGTAVRARCLSVVGAAYRLRGLDADVAAFFLPGVASQLAALASSDEKVQSSLTLELLAAVGSVLRGTVRDELNAHELRRRDHGRSPAEQLAALHAEARGGAAAAYEAPPLAAPEDLAVRRSGAWIDATARRLEPLLARVALTAAASGSWRVRYRLVGVLRVLLVDCARQYPLTSPPHAHHRHTNKHHTNEGEAYGTRHSPPHHHPPSSRNHEYLSQPSTRHVARAAASCVRTVGALLPSSADLADLVRLGAERQLSRLPAAMRGAAEPPKARALQLLCAQCHLLASGSALVPFAPSARRCSMRCGWRRCPLRSSSGRTTARMPPLDTARCAPRRLPRRRTRTPSSDVNTRLRHLRYSTKPFANLNSGASVQAASDLCRVIGAYGPLPSIIHQLLDAATDEADATTASTRAEARWVLNEVLLGAVDWRRRSAAGFPPTHEQMFGEEKADSMSEIEADNSGTQVVIKQRQGADEAPLLFDNAKFDPVDVDSTISLEPDAPPPGDESDREIVESIFMLLEELLSPSVWHSSRGQEKLSDLHLDIIEKELLMQLIGSAIALLSAIPTATRSDDLQEADAHPVALRLALFPTLERLGDRSATLSSAAEVTLCRLCVSIEPKANSIPHMLSTNSDFVLETLCARLRRAAWYPQTALVMQALLEFGGADTLPLVGDAIDDLLALIDDAAPGGPRADMIAPCLHALQSLVIASATHLASPAAAADAADATGGEAASAAGGSLSSFVDELVDELGLRATASDADDSGGAAQHEAPFDDRPFEERVKEDQEQEEEARAKQEAELRAADEAEQARATPPLVGQLALRTLAKAEVLLLTGSPSVTHLLLGTIKDLIPALQPWARALLRALYPVWSPLVVLMGGADLSVAAQAMAVLGVAATHLGEHLSSTVVRDALKPILRAIRQYGAPPEEHVRRGGVLMNAKLEYRSRPQELLLSATRTLSCLCSIPQLLRPEVWNLLGAAIPLLSCRQPARVQEEALALIGRLVPLNRDAVWFAVVCALPESERCTTFSPPLSALPSPWRELGEPPIPTTELALNARLVISRVAAEDQRVQRLETLV
ncbi:hypothetical protein AB1Y20_005387 [Prymnesium parvum]|uniref:HEAT repeat-containing protein 1 n=1 Tax=Prymnesium parvum TaxID=97485 RepID=A0AB34J3Z4_PRYPA